jgi:hypothetical protein
VAAILQFQRQPPSTGAEAFTSPDQKIPISYKAGTPDQRESSIALGPNDLYPELTGEDSTVIQALQLIGDCVRRLENAREIDGATDYIAFDEQMMRARQYMRQLFAFREIGDGFGATTNAILWALQNKESETLARRQLTVVIEVLRQLRMKPLLHFDTAMTFMDQLEDCELNIEPSSLEPTLEFGE